MCTCIWREHVLYSLCFLYDLDKCKKKKKRIKVKNSHVQFPSPSFLAFATGAEVSLGQTVLWLGTPLQYHSCFEISLFRCVVKLPKVGKPSCHFDQQQAEGVMALILI